MLNLILFSIALAVVGGINPNFSLLQKRAWREYFHGWGKRVLYGLLPAWFVFYMMLPGLAGPFWGLAQVVSQFWIVNALCSWWWNFKSIPEEERRPGVVSKSLPRGAIVFGALIVVFLIIGFMSTAIMQASNLHGVINVASENVTTAAIPSRSTEGFRKVTWRLAAWKADRALSNSSSNLGSRYTIPELFLQRINGEEYYVGPLQFRKGRHWWNERKCPGFVKVSAMDPEAEADLVLEIDGHAVAMPYMPSSWGLTRLERHVYMSGYATCYQTAPTFELDDSGRPYWILTVTRPAHYWAVEKIRYILVVDATTGVISEHATTDLPAWVDQAIPPQLTTRYINWWGKYGKGWWNATFMKDGIVRLSGSPGWFGENSLTLNWTEAGEPCFYGTLTGGTEGESSLYGVVRINARTGQGFITRTSGYDAAAAISTMTSRISNFPGWYASTPVLYRIQEKLTWAAPIVSEQGLFQRMAVMPLDSTQVGIGLGDEDALAKLAEQSAGSAQTKLTFPVSRLTADVIDGNTRYTFYSESYPEAAFVAFAKTNAELRLTKVGDSVCVTTQKLESALQGEIPVIHFDNLSLKVTEAFPDAEQK